MDRNIVPPISTALFLDNHPRVSASISYVRVDSHLSLLENLASLLELARVHYFTESVEAVQHERLGPRQARDATEKHFLQGNRVL